MKMPHRYKSNFNLFLIKTKLFIHHHKGENAQSYHQRQQFDNYIGYVCFKCRISIILFGLMTLAMGIILSMIPWLDYFILKNLKLFNGSLSFQYWQRPGVIRLTKVYIFNVTNPDSFLRYGEKPRLQEVGPFVYREDMQKINVKFHENGTVSFQHRKILEFVPELSVQNNVKLTVPNIPLLSLTSQSNSLGSTIRSTISILLMFSKYKPFVTLTPDQLVLGYDDTIIALAHQFYPKHKRPKDKMGLLLGRNGTISEISTIYTGENDMSVFGLIDNINGNDKLPNWNAAPCSNIHGSEGSFFPPRYFTKSDIVHIYDKDICRILPLKYRRSETKSGINVDLYTPTSDLYRSDLEANKCFCPNSETCPPKGLQSVSPCHFDAPIYVSNPHFFDAASDIRDAFDGLEPDAEKHGTYMKIQPKIGVPLEGKVRLQVNLKVERARDIWTVASFPSIYFPIMWLEEGVDELTPPIRRWIYLATTFCDIASPLVTYGCIFLGSCIVVAVIVNGYKSLIFTKETIEIGMKNLRRHSQFNRNYTILDETTAATV